MILLFFGFIVVHIKSFEIQLCQFSKFIASPTEVCMKTMISVFSIFIASPSEIHLNKMILLFPGVIVSSSKVQNKWFQSSLSSLQVHQKQFYFHPVSSQLKCKSSMYNGRAWTFRNMKISVISFAQLLLIRL